MSERVASLHLRVGDRSLTVVLAYGLNNSAEYPTFLEALGGVLESAPAGLRHSTGGLLHLCGSKVFSACRGGNPQIQWWTPEVRYAVKLEEGVLSSLVGSWTPEAADGYQQAKRAAAQAFAEAETRVWEKFGKAMEEDYQSVSKQFWQTIRRLRRGKQSSTNTVYSGCGELLTLTGDIVGRWKEYFEDLLNPTDTPSIEEAEAGTQRLTHSSLKPKSLR